MSDFLQSIPDWVKAVFGIAIAFGAPVGIALSSLYEYLCRGRKERLKVGCIVGAILLTVALSVIHFSINDVEDTTVYTTRTGSCYHRSSCDTLKSRYKTTIEDAEADGYAQCSICSPIFWAYANPVLWRTLLSSLVAFGMYFVIEPKIAKGRRPKKQARK